ncbi:MAG: MBL fold metallo-hydrolase [Nitrospirae bacterium]|nr:MBL fold metallo-hydrolase [Nitrospirota bacterium]
MKPSFHARLVNGPFEDPGLYVRLLRESRAFLFDAGFTANLSARDILKVSDIFISHTHVDHFIGFDNILRLHLRKEEPMRLYGPEGFLDRIEGKLKGYTWNLIGDYPLIIEAAEINEKTVTKARFRTQNSFKRENTASASFDGVLLKDSFFKVEAAVLDHQIPCLAFSMEEDYHINIDKAELNKLDLPVGQWLGELKQAIRDGAADRVFKINDKQFNFSELKYIANITRGQKLSYVVDTIGTEENMKKIIDLAKGSDVLYIEAYFLDRDDDRAKERYHLTAKEAGRIAREAGAGRLEVFHFSPKYTDVPGEIVKEAEEEFGGG